MKKLILISLLLLSACGTTKYKSPDLPVIIDSTTTEYLVPEVNIDNSILEDCAPLLELTQNADFNAIILVTKDNAILYSNSKNKHKALVEILTKSLNLKGNKNEIPSNSSPTN